MAGGCYVSGWMCELMLMQHMGAVLAPFGQHFSGCQDSIRRLSLYAGVWV